MFGSTRGKATKIRIYSWLTFHFSFDPVLTSAFPNLDNIDVSFFLFYTRNRQSISETGFEDYMTWLSHRIIAAFDVARNHFKHITYVKNKWT